MMMRDMDMGRTPTPLSASVEALLAHERVIVPQPDGARERVVARACEFLREAEASPPALSFLTSRRLLLSAAASVLLIAGGAAAYQLLKSPPPQARPSVPRPRMQRVVAPSPLAPFPSLAPAENSRVVAPSAARVSPRASTPTRRTDSDPKSEARPEELRLLVRAREANAREDYASVLSVASEHERRFPTGRLSEEREVLRIKALVGLGRLGEARQAASSFRRHFPRSVLLEKIESMLASQESPSR